MKSRRASVHANIFHPITPRSVLLCLRKKIVGSKVSLVRDRLETFFTTSFDVVNHPVVTTPTVLHDRRLTRRQLQSEQILAAAEKHQR